MPDQTLEQLAKEAGVSPVSASKPKAKKLAAPSLDQLAKQAGMGAKAPVVGAMAGLQGGAVSPIAVSPRRLPTGGIDTRSLPSVRMTPAQAEAHARRTGATAGLRYPGPTGGATAANEIAEKITRAMAFLGPLMPPELREINRRMEGRVIPTGPILGDVPAQIPTPDQLLGGAVAAPFQIQGDADVLIHPDATPEQRLRAGANIAINTGGAEFAGLKALGKIKSARAPKAPTAPKFDIPDVAGPKRPPISDDTLRLGAAAKGAGLSEPQALGAQVGAANIFRKGREAGKPVGGIRTVEKPKTGAMRQEQAAAGLLEGIEPTQTLRDVTKPQSIRELQDQLFGAGAAFVVPDKATNGGVLAMLKHDEVLRAVVGEVPVDVVDILRSHGMTPDEVLRDPSMLAGIPEVARGRTISGILDAESKVGASLSAKLASGLAAGSDVELLPALKASHLTPREVVGLLSPETIYHDAASLDSTKSRPASAGAELPAPTQGLSGIDIEGLAANKAIPVKSALPAGGGAELRGFDSAGLDAKHLPASLADALTRHSQIIRNAGDSLPLGSLTPEMKAAVLNEGQPLFQGEKPLFRGAADEGVARNGRYYTPDEREAKQYAEMAAIRRWLDDNPEADDLISEIMTEMGADELTDLDVKTIRDALKDNGFPLPEEVSKGVVAKRGLKGSKELDLTSLGNSLGDVDHIGQVWDDLHKRGLLDDAWDDLDEYVHDEIAMDYGGKAIYKLLESERVYDKAQALGYDIVKFEDQGLGGRTTHDTYVVLNSDVLLQRKKGGIKGTYDPRTRTIEFIQGKADFSTVVHEVAHYFHDWLKDDPKYGKLIRDTYGDLTDVKGAEQFARHYEQYLRSGKAPNPGLKNVFAAIAQWMKDIYQNWRHGKPSKEVKAIFDEIVGEQTPEVKELIRRFDEATGSKSEVPFRAGAPKTGKNFTEGAGAEGPRAAQEPPRGTAAVPDAPKPKSDKPATSVALRQSEERGILPETPGVRHDSELAAEAERLGLGTKEGAARLLEESKTRELQDHENFGLGARLAAIDEEMAGLDTGSPEYQALLDEAKAIRGIRGTETARALRSRGILAASDYTPSGFVAALENLTGKALKEAERRKYRAMAEEYGSLKNHLDEIQAELDKIRTRKRSGGGGRKATGTDEAIKSAWGDVFTAMGAEGKLGQISDIDVKMRHPLAKLVGEYLAKEPNTAKALKAAVADIKARTGIDLKPKDAHDLWAGYRSDRVGKKNPLSEEVLYVRRQARKVRADMERELVRAGRSVSEKLGEALSGASVELRLWNPVARAIDQGSNVAEQIVQSSTSGISRPVAAQMAKALKLGNGFKMLDAKQRAQVIARYGADVKEALSEATSGYGSTGPASHFAGQADAFVRAKVQLDYAGEQAAALAKDRGFDFGETLDQIRDPYLGGPLKFDEARKLHDAMREHGDIVMLTNANLLSRGRTAIRQSILQNKAMPRPVKAMSLAVVDLATSFTKVLSNVADRTAQYQHPSYGIARGAYEFYRAIAGKDLLPQQRAMFLRNGSAMFVRAGVGGVLHWLGYQLATDPDKRSDVGKLLNDIGIGKLDMGRYWGPTIVEGRSKDGKRTGSRWLDEGAWSQLGGSVAALTAGYRDAMIDQSDLEEEKKAGLKEQLRYAFLTDNPLMGNVKRAQQVFSGERELGDTLADWMIGLYYPGGLREWARIQQVQEGKFGVRPSEMFDGEAKTWQERAQIMLDALESQYAKRFPNLEKVDVPHVGTLSLPVKGHKGMTPIGVPYTGTRPKKGGKSSSAAILKRFIGAKRP